MTTDEFGNKLRSIQPISMAYRAAASVCLLAWISLLPAATQAQGMLPGCRLEGGSLQCVPGLTADPQQQINVLNKEISTDVQAEGRIKQTTFQPYLSPILKYSSNINGGNPEKPLVLGGNSFTGQPHLIKKRAW